MIDWRNSFQHLFSNIALYEVELIRDCCSPGAVRGWQNVCCHVVDRTEQSVDHRPLHTFVKQVTVCDKAN
jgi:hypothetical protein